MKKPVVSVEETKDDSELAEGNVLVAAEKLSLAIMAKTDSTKDLTKKANVSRANLRRMIREMEEAE